MTDPIADMLGRIRNTMAANKHQVNMPYSKIKETIAKILVDNGFIAVSTSTGTGNLKLLEITICDEGTSPKITEISRLSTPGRRLYAAADKIPVIKRGRGMVIVSTSRGVMSGADARAKRLGGELICKVF